MADTVPTITPIQVRLRDPLSEVTRKERRALLGVSLLGVVIAKTGLIPTQISALGVEFGRTDQRALLLVLAVVTGYFIIAFALYAASDFLAWRLALRSEMRDVLIRVQQGEEEDDIDRELTKRYPLWTRTFSRWTPYVSIARSLFEFLLPLLFGVYAIAVLLLQTVPT